MERSTLGAWWDNGIQHTRWICTKCGKQYHTTPEADSCCNDQKNADALAEKYGERWHEMYKKP